MKLQNDQIRHLTENEKALLYALIDKEYKTATLKIEPTWLNIERVVSIIDKRTNDLTGPGKRVAAKLRSKILE